MCFLYVFSFQDYFCSYFNSVSFDGCCSQGIWVQVTGAFGTIIPLESGRFP